MFFIGPTLDRPSSLSLLKLLGGEENAAAVPFSVEELKGCLSTLQRASTGDYERACVQTYVLASRQVLKRSGKFPSIHELMSPQSIAACHRLLADPALLSTRLDGTALDWTASLGSTRLDQDWIIPCFRQD